MGFGFSLIGIPLLLLLSVSLVLYFIFAKKRKALYALGILWGMVFLLILLAFALDQRRRPIQLTKADFVGDYRIDTTFYPGRNARWQYHRFAFRILESDSILFLAINDKGTRINVFRHEILVGDGSHYFWNVLADTTSHVIRHPPTLYRSHSRFYFVFRSDRYGNMFFRKVDS